MGMATRAMWTLLALLPAFGSAAPVFAMARAARPVLQARSLPVGQTLLAAPVLRLTPPSQLAPGAPVFSPGVAASPLAAATALLAPADAPRIVVPAPAQAAAAAASPERTGEILERLAPESVARVPGEEAKALSGELLGEASAARADAADPVLGGVSAVSRLAPAAAALHPAADAPRAPSSSPRRATWADHAHHWKLLAGSFTWYMTTNVANKWRGHREALARARQAGDVPVSRQREFFAAMRTTGMSGHFYVLGGSALEDAEVVVDMRAAFERYFDHPGVDEKARDSFENFMARASVYNTERRSHTYLYKTIRDAMIKASLMKPEALPAYFDGLLLQEMTRETQDFQNKGEQKRVADAFRAALLRVLDQEDPRDKNRVVAALVLGSFASGAAGPRSDFDVEVLTANGSDARVDVFRERVLAEWTAAGLHAVHPVSVHDHAARPSRAYLDLVHSADYFIVARNPGLVAELSRAPGESPAFTVDRARSPRGRAGLLFQGIIVRGTILAEELKAILR